MHLLALENILFGSFCQRMKSVQANEALAPVLKLLL